MKTLIATFFSVLTLFGFGQTNFDSLWTVWNDNTIPDTVRLKAMDDIVWEKYMFNHPDSAFYFAQMQYDFAKSKGRKTQMAMALNAQGASFHFRGNFAEALITYQKGIQFHESEDNQAGIASLLNNIGGIYQSQGDYPKALEIYRRCLKIWEEVGDINGMATSSGNIGLIYLNQGEYQKALEYFRQSLEKMEQDGDEIGIALSLHNIGKCNHGLNENPKALDHFLMGLEKFEKLGDQNGVALTIFNIGTVYQSQKEYATALEYFKRSLKIREEIGDKNGAISSLIGIGRIHHQQAEFQSAIAKCNEALALAQQTGALSKQKIACDCLYNAHKELGNADKALEFHEKMLKVEESLQSEETATKLQQIDFQKKVQADSLKQQEEKLLVQLSHQREVAKKDKTRNLLMGGGLLLLLLATGLYARMRYVRKAKAKIEIERDRSDNLLLNILPAEIAEELKEKGEAKARNFEMVSILFTDFKGFTEASEKLSAADLVQEINVCFREFDGIVENYGIEKIKTIGDAYMAAGGLPVPDENAARNTVLAGLAMQDFMKARKIRRDAEGLPAFEMRVGIHTGPVVAGIVGVKKFQYDIWGDTVNTASRMESSGEVGQVNISEATYKLVKDISEFGFTSRGKIEAKGKGEMEMYFADRA